MKKNKQPPGSGLGRNVNWPRRRTGPRSAGSVLRLTLNAQQRQTPAAMNGLDWKTTAASKPGASLAPAAKGQKETMIKRIPIVWPAEETRLEYALKVDDKQLVCEALEFALGRPLRPDEKERVITENPYEGQTQTSAERTT